MRVQATSVGVAGGILRQAGDVFDLASPGLLADARTDYCPGQAGAPVTGWMSQVADGAALVQQTLPIAPTVATRRRTCY